MKFLKKAKGFTIIEVLIVLAIAGLILSIVFLAVPQLQRNARDSKRQSIATRLSTELGSYAGNNQGTYPFVGVAGYNPCVYQGAPTALSCNDWYSRYVCSSNPCTTANEKINIDDPSTGSPTVINYGFAALTNANYTAGNAWITVGATCSGDKAGVGVNSTSSKKFAVTIALERNQTFYCVDNG
jgi:prepilin-type N-terminal cleavage/methylation domain-containing protein